MDTYREECIKAKRVREGIIELRPVPIRKRKKIDKPWTVYVLSTFFPKRLFGLGKDFSRFMAEYNFPTEDQATRYADKMNRRGYEGRYVRVANNEGRP